MLLKVDIPGFQQKIIDLLMDALCSEHSGDGGEDDDAGGGGSSASSSRLPFCTVALQHLRWLDYVADSEALSRKLMECIDVCPFKVQRDIVLMIPEIVGDVELDDLVEFLLEKMEEYASLTVAILDALTNLHLAEDSLESVMDRVIQQLQSSELEVSMWFKLRYGLLLFLQSAVVVACSHFASPSPSPSYARVPNLTATPGPSCRRPFPPLLGAPKKRQDENPRDPHGNSRAPLQHDRIRRRAPLRREGSGRCLHRGPVS